MKVCGSRPPTRRFVKELCLATALSSCATMNEDLWQTVRIRTIGVPGAQCTLTSPTIGMRSLRAPGSLRVLRGRDSIDVRCAKECFEDAFGVITSKANWNEEGLGMALSGPFGATFDAFAGTAFKYDDWLELNMAPTGCLGKQKASGRTNSSVVLPKEHRAPR